ncbi:MAG: VTT domain-containing protein [Candidatus Taylorbacteria bacterium]|nr:VTT domain-containing protein [Candidatus Taylorbacteria bacterium]
MPFLDYIDPLFIIKTLGLIGVVLIIFAESGLFFGFFLPGDSLLFTAGFLASQGLISIWWLLTLCFIAAVVGDNVGYYFGKKVGPMIFKREDSLFFHKKHVETARSFYNKHGKKAIILARFIPIGRTFVPIVAGVAQMDHKTFMKYNLIGGFLWTWLLLGLGYLLGNAIPNAEKYLTPIILAIIVISFIPAVIEFFKERKKVI